MAHGNARLTPFGRALLVRRSEQGWTITAVAPRRAPRRRQTSDLPDSAGQVHEHSLITGGRSQRFVGRGIGTRRCLPRIGLPLDRSIRDTIYRDLL
jgi:hypothetical protein